MNSFFILLLFFQPSSASLTYPTLVDQFYRQRHQSLFWFVPGDGAAALRQQLRMTIDSAAWRGLDSGRYHPKEVRDGLGGISDLADSAEQWRWDRIYTDAAITFCKDLYQGSGIYSMISYDGVSPQYEEADCKFLLNKLMGVGSALAFKELTDSLEPTAREYRSLRDSLYATLRESDVARQRPLAAAMNGYRWMHHHRFNRFIVVNIPSATLRYYEGDSVKLGMKVVAGQVSKRTPRFAAWCDKIVLYPYWNVPRKIAVNELLPIFKRSPSMVDVMNMQIIDSRGRVLDPALIPWGSYNKENFPYSIRQSTGCDNALGVIKFDINSPYDVYMHDTNFKLAFLSSRRYYSHGCIRLEKPIELGNELLHNKLDTTFLRSCLKDQQPVTLSVDSPVPVYVVYFTAEADITGKVNYHKDVYHLSK
jgi:hypothetical protein